ncbi:hypothetical protein AAGS40_29340 (plasmid) [Paraburkholderia sp. PREW-6R]|uniref:hypothetical protein n=1 Tax=Paraburkholderia sp. PREW-6R TaxID=3141544 RepID=UPI0031F5C7C9
MKAVQRHLRERRALKMLMLAALWFSACAMAIGGRGGGEGGARGGEGSRSGSEGGWRFSGRVGGSGDGASPGITRDGFGNRLPGVVTADEEGGKVRGHQYDPEGIDLTEKALHPRDYAVLSGGHLVNWQSATDAGVSEAKAFRAGHVKTFATLICLAFLAIALSMFIYR